MNKEHNGSNGKFMMIGCFGGLLIGAIINNIVMGLAFGLLVGTLVDVIISSKMQNHQ